MHELFETFAMRTRTACDNNGVNIKQVTAMFDNHLFVSKIAHRAHASRQHRT